MRVYYKELEYNTIFVINSLVSTSLFLSSINVMLLSRPILDAKFLPSQIKIANHFLSLGKKSDTKFKPFDFTFLYETSNF